MLQSQQSRLQRKTDSPLQEKPRHHVGKSALAWLTSGEHDDSQLECLSITKACKQHTWHQVCQSDSSPALQHIQTLD